MSDKSQFTADTVRDAVKMLRAHGYTVLPPREHRAEPHPIAPRVTRLDCGHVIDDDEPSDEPCEVCIKDRSEFWGHLAGHKP